jgi:hypothetical protein
MVLRERRERAYREARVPASFLRRGGSGSTPAGFWLPLVDDEAMTRFGRSR